MPTILSCISNSYFSGYYAATFPRNAWPEILRTIRRHCLRSKHLRRTVNGSSVIAIDAGGQIGLGSPTLVLECFKLGNYDSISHLSFSVLRVDVPARRPL